MYIELHASSAFSFLRAASVPETLVDRAALLGYPAVALLDRDGVSGAPRFHKAALAAGLRPLIGAELTIETAGRSHEAVRRLSLFHLPVLVSSQEGWRNLCRLISRMKLRAPKGEGALTLAEMDGYTTGLVAMPGRPLLQAERYGVGGLLDRIVGTFGRANTYVELQRHLHRDQEDDNDTLACLADAFRVPVVATGGVSFATPEERPLFDVLTSIREHIPLHLRRAPAGGQRRALPEAAGANGAAVCRSPRGRAGHARAGRSPAVQHARPRLSLSEVPGARRRERELVPAQDRGSRRARSLPAVLRQGARCRWRASST